MTMPPLGPVRKWAARTWPPLLFVAAFGLLWRGLPARPLVTVVCPEGPAFPCFASDGTRLLAQSQKDKSPLGPVRVWELPAGRDVTGPLAEYHIAGFARPLPHGELLLVTQEEGTEPFALRLVELATGRERLRLDFTRGCSYCLAADGRRLAWVPEGRNDSAIEVCDLSTGRRDACLEHGGLVALSPDGRTLISHPGPPWTDHSHLDNLVVWDVARGRDRDHIASLVAPCPNYWVRFSPDGHTLAVDGIGPQKGFLKLWDLDAGQERAVLPGLYRFDFIRQGRVLAATGFTPDFANRVRCWDVMTGRELESIRCTPSAGTFGQADLRASPDGRRLAVQTGSDIPAWELAVPLRPRRVLWRQEGRSLSELKVFDAVTGRELATLPGAYMERYAWSPDGGLLAVAREDGRIDVWQVPPRKPVWLAAGLAGVLVGAALLLRRWPRRRGAGTKRAGANESPPPHKERLLSP